MRCKTYPRLALDVTWRDLIWGIFRVSHSSSRSELEEIIRDYWSTSRSVQVTLSVRTAFDLLLQALAFPRGTEIVISGVNIRHMVEIIEFHHLIAVPVDLDWNTLAPNLDHFRSLISPQTRLFLVAHLFGSVIPLAPYLALCRQHGILVVEDCAQAFAGSDYFREEQADVSLFSFGPIKTCTAFGGGVALVGDTPAESLRDRDLASRMEALHRSYPVKPDFSYRQRLIKYSLLKLISYPIIYHQCLIFLRWLGQDLDRAIAATARGFAGTELIPQLRQQPATLLLQFLARRLKHHGSYQWRIDQAKAILDRLKPSNQWPGFQSSYHSFWVVPIYCCCPQTLMERLRQHGFDATQGNTSLMAIAPSQGKPLPQCQKLMENILYLPLSPLLPRWEHDRLLDCLKQKNLKI